MPSSYYESVPDAIINDDGQVVELAKRKVSAVFLRHRE